MNEQPTGIQKLLDVMRRLRAPGGCPWDREQTLHTLKPCLLEETYELLDAIDRNDVTLHREELGDVLLQVVFKLPFVKRRNSFPSTMSPRRLPTSLSGDIRMFLEI